jgi:hypothetical protein
MKKITVILLAVLLASCSPKFNKIKTSDAKFSVWTIVEKYEVYDTGCVYYWNRGRNSFIDDCNKYDVGDTIKHQ